MDDRSIAGAADIDPWLTVPQVSDELKIHPATVRVWINSGRLAAVRAGRTWRVRRSELDRALRADTSAARGQAVLEPAHQSPPRLAPRQIADHIMTITPAARPSS
jgi:excisionase family DNA binding protein